jgi:enterochelin esterase-like enzyme
LILDFALDCPALGECRGVTVVLPPGYTAGLHYPVLFCADGQAVRVFAQYLEPEIAEGNLPPIILVGVHSVANSRSSDYLSHIDQQRYLAHQQFFTDDVFDWTYSRFDICFERTMCGIFGFSHGADFALATGARHHLKYGVVIAFSIAGGCELPEESLLRLQPSAKYYLSAGTREKPIRARGRAFAKQLSKHGVENLITERHAGHELTFWGSELPHAIRWAFSERHIEEHLDR